MRRQFTLPDRDVRFLDSLGLPWETTRQANDLWVIVHDHPAPPGYDRPFTNIAIKIEAGYPDAQLDMAYFCPGLSRRDGKPIPQSESRIPLDGQNYQRWSRHRTAEHPWLPGEDCLETHMDLVRDWLRREFERRP